MKFVSYFILAFIDIGEYLHLGKGTSFGLGKIKIN